MEIIPVEIDLEIDLKPCPFCGGKPKVFETYADDRSGQIWIECSECYMETVKIMTKVWQKEKGYFSIFEEAKKLLADRWNKRSDDGQH